MSVLVVQHEPECPPALLGRWLAQQGVGLDVRHPYLGEPLPASLAEHSGLLVLGGHMGANDDEGHPWLTHVKALLRDAAGDGVAALGVCLGHQLAAVALGGTVRRNPRGKQRGLLDVGWTVDAAADPLLGALATPRRGVQSNNDLVTDLPPGGTVLARTSRGEIQAARFAPTVWGVQLHPEADARVVASWAEADPFPGADQHVATVAAAGPELEAAWRPLAASFAVLVRARSSVNAGISR